MEALISVIIPIYNVENYLRRCVDGIRSQTYRNLEIILVDDESPDGCGAICDAYALEDDRIRVIHQKNRGLSGARNAGIDAARGDYLVFVDSDDYVTEDFIGRLYEALVSTGSDLAQCKWNYVQGGPIPDPALDTGTITVYTGTQMMANLYIPDGAYYVVAWNKLYRKELFEGIRYPEGRIHEDEATTYKIYDRIGQAAMIDSCMYGYFTGNDSITRGKFSRKRLDWAWAVHERILFLEDKTRYEHLMPAALKAFADGCIDLYFKCARYLPDAKEEKAQMRNYVRESLKRCAGYGGFPVRTALGYRLFLTLPGLYRRILNY
ncbi:MAG: glycosyltransferase family 2 protein [Lachnospiraceae bacterium]|nr:glycosyltransferase family 2 protein [Lachnospiraceae bacterium]